MSLNYLIDENVNPIYPQQIKIIEPSINVKVIGEKGTPSRGTLDPDILDYCSDLF